jgi:hypothetical protein
MKKGLIILAVALAALAIATVGIEFKNIHALVSGPNMPLMGAKNGKPFLRQAGNGRYYYFRSRWSMALVEMRGKALQPYKWNAAGWVVFTYEYPPRITIVSSDGKLISDCNGTSLNYLTLGPVQMCEITGDKIVFLACPVGEAGQSVANWSAFILDLTTETWAIHPLPAKYSAISLDCGPDSETFMIDGVIANSGGIREHWLLDKSGNLVRQD